VIVLVLRHRLEESDSTLRIGETLLDVCAEAAWPPEVVHPTVFLQLIGRNLARGRIVITRPSFAIGSKQKPAKCMKDGGSPLPCGKPTTALTPVEYLGVLSTHRLLCLTYLKEQERQSALVKVIFLGVGEH
jgi:hypothetical protein